MASVGRREPYDGNCDLEAEPGRSTLNVLNYKYVQVLSTTKVLKYKYIPFWGNVLFRVLSKCT